MYCPNCGKAHAASDMFCSECGTSLQVRNQVHSSIEEASDRPKKNYNMLFVIAAAVVLLIALAGSGKDDMEYTNNSGDKLPIVVNGISYQDSFWTGFIDITFEIENLTQTDYKNVHMAVLAWDRDGYPIRLGSMSDFDPDYVSYISFENISPNRTSESSYTFKSADIAYMSVFLSYYEDFSGKEWENPVIENVEKNQGQKLDETELYYFTFQ